MTARGGLRPPLFLLVCMLWVRWRRDARYSAVRGTCGCRSQKVVARAAPPCGPLRGSGPWLARPPARAIGFSGVPAANGGARLRAALRGSAACSRGGGSDSMGGAVPPPLVRCGGCPSLRRVRWCLPGVGAVVVAPPGAGPFRSASLKAPGAAPPPVPAPLRLRARGGGSAGCGQRGRPPALAGELTMK